MAMKIIGRTLIVNPPLNSWLTQNLNNNMISGDQRLEKLDCWNSIIFTSPITCKCTQSVELCDIKFFLCPMSQEFTSRYEHIS